MMQKALGDDSPCVAALCKWELNYNKRGSYSNKKKRHPSVIFVVSDIKKKV